MAIGDLDGDGNQDLVIVRKQPIYLSGGASNLLFINQGGIMVDKTAQLAPCFLDATEDRDVIIKDLNNDSFPDVVTAATFGDPPRVYINLGNDENGWRGLCYCYDKETDTCHDQAYLNTHPLCRQDDTQNCFADIPALNDDIRIQSFDPAPFFCGVAVGDIDGDLDFDLYFVDYDRGQQRLFDRLLINDGNGFFDDRTEALICPDPPAPGCFNKSLFGTGAQIIDLDGDDCNDIVKSEARFIDVVYNSKDPQGQCTGDFTAATVVNLATGDPYMFVAGDVNKDDEPDLYVVRDVRDQYRINLGGGNFSGNAAGAIVVTNSPKVDVVGGNVRMGDMNGDDFPDLVVSDVDVAIPDCTSHQLAILRTDVPDPINDPFNVTIADPLGSATRDWNTSGTYDSAVFDVDGDGTLDLWSGTCSGNRLFMQGSTIEDCNANGVPDACDIHSGSSADCNSNGVPDECEGAIGACCMGGGSCQELLEACCADAGGSFLGAGTVCNTQVGACCIDPIPGFPFGKCKQRTECSCEQVGGFFYPFANCATFNCPTELGPQPGG